MAEKMLTLMSSDNKKFQIAETVAAQSKFLSDMIEDDCHQAIIPIPTANATTLAKVIQYCNRHSGRFSSSPSASVRPSSSSASSSSTSASVPRPNLVDRPSSSSASSSSFPSNSGSVPILLDELSSLTISDDDDDDLKLFDEQFVKVHWNTLMDITVVAHHLHIQSLFHLCCKAAAEHIKDFSVDKLREYFNIENDFTPEEEEQLRRENPWAFEE